MTRAAALLAALFLAATPDVGAQAPPASPSDAVYDRSRLARVDVVLPADSLRRVLENPQSDHEVPATFVYRLPGAAPDTVARVGFRLRGNTSRNAQKKSFKVSMNTFVRGRAWRGLEKLNLNGEHNDPSLVRSTLGWALFEDVGVAASRSAFVEVYLNGAFYGVYANTEHLDETFLGRRFGTERGDLFKCLYPANLAYRGTSGTDYTHRDGSGRPVYELAQGEDSVAAYARLARFVDRLNRTPAADFPAQIEQDFDVNAFLKVLAVDVATGSWDNYWYNQNNYYLRFDPETGRATYLPYDYDNSYGVDFVGRDWGTRNPYTWGSSGDPRPLVSRLMAVPDFRARYTFYLRRLLDGPFAQATQDARIDALHALVEAAALRDPYRTKDYGFSASDFQRSADVAWGGHVKYGLKPFVQTRRSSLLSALDRTNVPPIVHFPDVLPARPTALDSLVVTALVEDEAAPAWVRLVEGANAPAEMFDDGTHGDARAGDGTFTRRVAPAAGLAERTFAVRARDAAGQERTSPARTVRVAPVAAGLVVNEFVASNDGAFRDPAGDADDWIELFNPTPAPVRLLGYTLTDDLSAPAKWAFPDTTVAPGGYLIVWADDEAAEGPLHAAFKLGASGEAVGLFRGGVQVDAVAFGPQASGVSTGRAPNGTGSFAALPRITPGTANPAPTATDDAPAAPDEAPRLFPVPFTDRFTLALPRSSEPTDVAVFDVLGRVVQRAALPGGAATWTMEAALPPGVYLVRVEQAGRSWTVRALGR